MYGPDVGKKSETELTARVLKKRSKTHKRFKERCLTGRNRTKRAHFRGGPLFHAAYNIKTEEKKTINSTCLVSVRCRRLAEGKGHETDSKDQKARDCTREHTVTEQETGRI